MLNNYHATNWTNTIEDCVYDHILRCVSDSVRKQIIRGLYFNSRFEDAIDVCLEDKSYERYQQTN